MLESRVCNAVPVHSTSTYGYHLAYRYTVYSISLVYMRLWEQKWVIGLNKRNAPNGASKFRTIIHTQIDNIIITIYTLTLRYFSNTFHHDSAPARPRPREVQTLLLNVRRRPMARWKGFFNFYALSAKIAIWLREPDDWFLLSEPHILILKLEDK